MVVLFIISFYTNNQEIASPPVAFFAPFSLAAIDLIYNVDKWRVELKNNTYLTVHEVFGVLGNGSVFC